MKKIKAAILIFDVVAGLLLFCVFLGRLSGGNAIAGGWRGTENNRIGENASGDRTGEITTCGKAEGQANGSRTDDMAQETDDKAQKKIALTFDDGPHPQYTEQLLDGLKARNVRATFFVTGEHAVLHPDVIERMHEDA